MMAITFFEYVFLRLLGFHYDSIGALVLFFVVYLFLELPLSLITNAIPRALKSLDMINSSKGWPAFVLQTGSTFGLVALLDHFMAGISINWQGALIFALCSGLINMKVREEELEPPAADSDEFDELEKKFNSKNHKKRARF
ncbi:hypothetical protein L1279_001182 [Planomicrobium sp. HSC-17F08]|nr:hypothetical protein [Planomicrobium sp. HSC-17F08]